MGHAAGADETGEAGRSVTCLRMSDARMSGTSYGACILHVAPESYIGGPLALVKSGDMVTVDVEKRLIQMEVSDDELARRKAAWTPQPPRYERGLRQDVF